MGQWQRVELTGNLRTFSVVLIKITLDHGGKTQYWQEGVCVFLSTRSQAYALLLLAGVYVYKCLCAVCIETECVRYYTQGYAHD